MEYEALYLICFKCGKYGHKIGDCISPNLFVETTPVAIERTQGVDFMVNTQQEELGAQVNKSKEAQDNMEVLGKKVKGIANNKIKL